jgi:hypothetical protein
VVSTLRGIRLMGDDLQIALRSPRSLQWRKLTMVASKDFQPDIPTAAQFLQARTALDGGEKVVILDFKMLDFDSPTTVGMKCPLDNVRKLVHTCLKALESFGDQPASVLLKVLKQSGG